MCFSASAPQVLRKEPKLVDQQEHRHTGDIKATNIPNLATRSLMANCMVKQHHIKNESMLKFSTTITRGRIIDNESMSPASARSSCHSTSITDWRANPSQSISSSSAIRRPGCEITIRDSDNRHGNLTPQSHKIRASPDKTPSLNLGALTRQIHRHLNRRNP